MDHHAAEPVRAGLQDLGAVMKESSDLHLFLSNPAVSRDKKVTVMEIILDRIGVAPEARPLLRNLLNVVVDHRRAALLPEIADEYAAELNKHEGIAVAQVTSASQLEAEKRTRLETALSQVTKQKIAAGYAVDPALVGGAVVRIGDTIYDGSVEEHLRRLEQSLASE